MPRRQPIQQLALLKRDIGSANEKAAGHASSSTAVHCAAEARIEFVKARHAIAGRRAHRNQRRPSALSLIEDAPAGASYIGLNEAIAAASAINRAFWLAYIALPATHGSCRRA